jgi:hypothetical protein
MNRTEDDIDQIDENWLEYLYDVGILCSVKMSLGFNFRINSLRQKEIKVSE